MYVSLYSRLLNELGSQILVESQLRAETNLGPQGVFLLRRSMNLRRGSRSQSRG
jgi:hypothetical protein